MSAMELLGIQTVPASGKDRRMSEMKDRKSAKNALLFFYCDPIYTETYSKGSHSVRSTIVRDEYSKECPEWSMKEKNYAPVADVQDVQTHLNGCWQ